jgi:archaellum biogenesis ATPase FlaH
MAMPPNTLSPIILSFLMASSLAISFTGAITNPSSTTIPTIEVPMLSSTVVINGGINTSNEWSDASKTNVTLTCYVGVMSTCIGAPADNVSALIWMKHDSVWLYFLLEVPFEKRFFDLLSAQRVNEFAEVDMFYCWSPGGRPPWTACDDGFVGISPSGSYYAGDGWMPNGQWAGEDTKQSYGQNNVVGAAKYDGVSYWFEFKKMLASNDGYDWTLKPGTVYGDGGVDGTFTISFGAASGKGPRWGQYAQIWLCPCVAPVTISRTLTSKTTISQSASSSQATTSAQAMFVLPASWGSLLGIGFVALAASLSTVLIIKKRKHARVVGASIATGYDDFDNLLSGGLPLDYTVLIISPPCDERDLLLRRIVHSTVSSGGSAFYVLGDIGKAQDLATRYQKDFYAYCTKSDHIATHLTNLFGTPSIGNLSEFNIVLNQSLTTKVKEDVRKVIIVDILSDILLQYKALTTRKWLTEFIAKRKSAGFTVVATLNPYLAKEDVQAAVLDLFDGVLEIYEKKLKEKSRRFLTVKKLYGRKYSQKDIMLDADKLWT